MKLISSLFYYPVFTASGQQNEISLNPVTVTATLQPEPVSRTGRNITTLNGAHFNQLPVHSIDELLRYIPGV